MVRHADSGNGDGKPAGAGESGGTKDELSRMVEAEMNEGGPPLPEYAEVSVQQSAQSQGAPGISAEKSPSGPCPAPHEVVRLPLGAGLYGAMSETLLKTSGFELIRLVLPAGKEIATHEAPSEVTVQCIEGSVSLTRDGSTKELKPGELLHMLPGEQHSVLGLEHSSLLLTLRLPLSRQSAKPVGGRAGDDLPGSRSTPVG